MQKFDQKVIILFGTYNSGKTIIYNLFKKEENYKYLDINPEHIQFDDIKKQLDLKSWNRLKVILKNNRIKEYEVFEKYVLYLMNRFPDSNFVIKSGQNEWVHENDLNKKFICMNVFRHPKLSWLTKSYTMSLEKFIDLYKNAMKVSYENYFIPEILVENILNDKLLNKLIINKKNLKNIKSITPYDSKYLKRIDLNIIHNELTKIDDEFGDILNRFNNNNIDKIINLTLNKLKKDTNYIQKFDQKVTIIHGTFNSGKTIIYNLFRKEENYKYLDLDLSHNVTRSIQEQTDLESWVKLKPLLKNNKIKKYEVFKNYVLYLIDRFPNSNFIIKSGQNEWIDSDKVDIIVEKFNHLLVFRNPKISWITQSTRKYISLKKFINMHIDFLKLINKNLVPTIHVEDISNDILLNKLIKNKRNLKTTKTITSHDIELLKQINKDTIYKDLKRIDNELGDLLKPLNYNNEEIDKSINLILEGKYIID
jgi:hypothetical protein